MTKEKNDKQNTSGRVHIERDIIFWDYQNKNILQIDSNDIVVIGEYTNSDGPWFDDWFLTFVTKDGNWQSIPCYADNIDDLKQYLNNKFRQDLDLFNLANSTEWKSIVLYPLRIKGKTLFALTPSDNYKAPKTLFDKIRSSVGIGNFDTTQNTSLTDDVKTELASACR